MTKHVLFTALFLVPLPIENVARAADDIDTEHMFGFTEGSDIGKKGDREFELSTFGRLGKTSGRYSVFSTATSGKFTILDDIRISPGISILRHDIGGVPGIADRNAFAFEGASLEMKYRVLRRADAPFGLTIGAMPAWAHTDAATGARTREFGTMVSALFDKELVADKVVGALNFNYEASISRVPGAIGWSRASAMGMSAGLTTRVAGSLFMGGEVRYARAMSGTFLNAFVSHSISIGPTLYYKPTEHSFISAVWSRQVFGRGDQVPNRLDLTNFERNEVRLLYGAAF
ncbi:hypothetical protein PY365_26515 [Roseiarcaceae bacterium H3SJ34-1]|uniref:hypothetical protein n=1 Tax=Terripilifer ovatus TaxID=3032367 RepID=UPI003AB93CA8|nr:hypothetical protein [Roseiarcaceae bacterium H3SJ34-1]